MFLTQSLKYRGHLAYWSDLVLHSTNAGLVRSNSLFAQFVFDGVVRRLIFLYVLQVQHVIEHLSDFLDHEGHWPQKYVHEVWQNIRMGSVVKLLNVNLGSFELYYCPFIVVHVSVVGSREYRDHDREPAFHILFMHFVSLQLDLVSSYYREKFVFL